MILIVYTRVMFIHFFRFSLHQGLASQQSNSNSRGMNLTRNGNIINNVINDMMYIKKCQRIYRQITGKIFFMCPHLLTTTYFINSFLLVTLTKE